MYIIRKNPRGGISATSGSIMGPIVFLSIPIISIVVIAHILNISLNELSMNALIIFGGIFLLIIVAGIAWIIKILRHYKVKRYKNSGGGIVKKAKVVRISFYVPKEKDNSFFGFYVEAREGNMIYCSDAYKKGHIGGNLIQTLKEVKKSYEYKIDENEMNECEIAKQEALKQLSVWAKEKQQVANSGGLLERLASKLGKFIVDVQEDSTEKGYQPLYWEVNGHRITVGDTVDVYIDPGNENNYWMDIDFLFEE